MELREYLTKSGINPYRKWFNSLRDIKTKARIESRLTRIELGHFGDYKPVGEGVFELCFYALALYVWVRIQAVLWLGR